MIVKVVVKEFSSKPHDSAIYLPVLSTSDWIAQ